MRIALLIGAMGAGGAERVMAGLACELDRRGHEIHLITLDRPGRGSFYPLTPSIARQELDLLAYRSRAINTARRVLALRGCLERVDPDVIVSFMDTMNVTAVLANLPRRRPLVISERVDPSHQPIGRARAALRRATYPLADRLVVQTATIASFFDGWMDGRVLRLPNPVRPTERAASPGQRNPEGRFLLLGLGRLMHQKGFDLLVEAFGELAAEHPRWDLRILGEGEERPRLEARLRRLGLEDRSSLPGLVRDVHAELERAHLFAFPSRYEGFPNALGEALATGLPALAFRGVSGVEELVLEGHSGLLADRSGDPIRERAALVAALRALMGDSERREAMGAAARASIRRYRPEQIYAEWEDLLGSLLAEAESGARSRRAAPSPRGRSA